VRFRGGGHKQSYRIVDFKRRKLDIPAKVERIEYDPNGRPSLRLFVMPTANSPTSSRRSAWRLATK